MPSSELRQPGCLLDKATAVATGAATGIRFGNQVIFQAKLAGESGAVSCTIKLWASLDAGADSSLASAAKELLATFVLSGTGGGVDVAADSGAWPVEAPYRKFWGEITAISGAGAAVSLFAGV